MQWSAGTHRLFAAPLISRKDVRLTQLAGSKASTSHLYGRSTTAPLAWFRQLEVLEPLVIIGVFHMILQGGGRSRCWLHIWPLGSWCNLVWIHQSTCSSQPDGFQSRLAVFAGCGADGFSLAFTKEITVSVDFLFLLTDLEIASVTGLVANDCSLRGQLGSCSGCVPMCRPRAETTCWSLTCWPQTCRLTGLGSTSQTAWNTDLCCVSAC